MGGMLNERMDRWAVLKKHYQIMDSNATTALIMLPGFEEVRRSVHRDP